MKSSKLAEQNQEMKGTKNMWDKSEHVLSFQVGRQKLFYLKRCFTFQTCWTKSRNEINYKYVRYIWICSQFSSWPPKLFYPKTMLYPPNLRKRIKKWNKAQLCATRLNIFSVSKLAAKNRFIQKRCFILQTCGRGSRNEIKYNHVRHVWTYSLFSRWPQKRFILKKRHFIIQACKTGPKTEKGY